MFFRTKLLRSQLRLIEKFNRCAFLLSVRLEYEKDRAVRDPFLRGVTYLSGGKAFSDLAKTGSPLQSG